MTGKQILLTTGVATLLTGLIITTALYGGSVSAVKQSITASVHQSLNRVDSELLKAIRTNYTEADIEDSSVQIVKKIDINNDGTEDLILQIMAEEVCGTAGCPYEFFLKNEVGWKRVRFGFSGDDIKIPNSRTNGYVDVELNSLRIKWDGLSYSVSEVTSN